MKKFILSLVLFSISSLVFAQMKPFDFSKYEVVDSLPIERIMIHFDKDIDNDEFISLGNGDYMAPVPHKDKMIIKKTSDGSMAIVLYNSYCFGRHFEFNVKEDERRVILWYDNGGIYCGYVYDKEFKVAKYYESKKQFKRFIRHPYFERKWLNRQKN